MANSKRFVSYECRVSDTEPDISSDGYVGHYATAELAKQATEDRNGMMDREAILKAKEGRTWRRVPRKHFFAWLLPEPEYTNYID